MTTVPERVREWSAGAPKLRLPRTGRPLWALPASNRVSPNAQTYRHGSSPRGAVGGEVGMASQKTAVDAGS
jgi:hypothetical protein